MFRIPRTCIGLTKETEDPHEAMRGASGRRGHMDRGGRPYSYIPTIISGNSVG